MNRDIHSNRFGRTDPSYRFNFILPGFLLAAFLLAGPTASAASLAANKSSICGHRGAVLTTAILRRLKTQFLPFRLWSRPISLTPSSSFSSSSSSFSSSFIREQWVQFEPTEFGYDGFVLRPLDASPPLGSNPNLFQKRAAALMRQSCDSIDGSFMEEREKKRSAEEDGSIDGSCLNYDSASENLRSSEEKGKKKNKKGMPAKNLMAERRRRKKLNDRLYMLLRRGAVLTTALLRRHARVSPRQGSPPLPGLAG